MFRRREGYCRCGHLDEGGQSFVLRNQSEKEKLCLLFLTPTRIGTRVTIAFCTDLETRPPADKENVPVQRPPPEKTTPAPCPPDCAAPHPLVPAATPRSPRRPPLHESSRSGRTPSAAPATLPANGRRPPVPPNVRHDRRRLHPQASIDTFRKRRTTKSSKSAAATAADPPSSLRPDRPARRSASPNGRWRRRRFRRGGSTR